MFGALSERQGQLSGLIRNTATVFETTAQRNADLQQLFTVLPTFLRESRTTLTRLDQFAATSDPVVTKLRPAVRELTPTLQATARLAPELRGLFIGLRPVIDRAPSGFAAIRRLLDVDLPPILDRLDPFLDELTPLLTVLRAVPPRGHRLPRQRRRGDQRRQRRGQRAAPVPAHGRAVQPRDARRVPRRAPAHRPHQPLRRPGRLQEAQHRARIVRDRASARAAPTRSSTRRRPSDPDFQGRFPFADDPAASRRTSSTASASSSSSAAPRSATLPAPGCNKQAPFDSIGGASSESTDYLHVRSLP